MSNTTLKIITLNLWRYTHWDERRPLIVDLINKLNPDIILLQEVQRDISYSTNDQATELRKLLGYEFSHFEIACIKTTRKGVSLPFPIEHGLGLISRIPFKTEVFKLTQTKDDTEQRILLKVNFRINNHMGEKHTSPLTITNVHFSNKDEWAEAHLKECLNIFKENNVKTILAGDFNIKNIVKYKNMYNSDYITSADLFSYISYPEDNTSYDYILLPKEYIFTHFQCRDEVVSDHKLLFATIQIKK